MNDISYTGTTWDLRSARFGKAHVVRCLEDGTCWTGSGVTWFRIATVSKFALASGSVITEDFIAMLASWGK
jgi:transposase